jgi:hypothetical protein
LTATLIEQGHNRLRYLLASNTTGGTTLDITTTGAASPDLKTDSLYGPVKVCALAFTDGLGKLAAGALTQAQARAIWMAQSSDTVLGNSKVPRCLPRLTIRDGAAVWTVDANVDGSGHPVVHVTATDIGDAYLDIQTQGAIGI